MKQMSIENTDGFTLVEVLLAILVFVLGFLPLVRLEVASIQANSYAHRLTQATNLAEGKMDSLLAMNYNYILNKPITPEDGITLGNYKLWWNRTEITTIESFTVDEVLKIEVTVKWKDKNGTREIKLSSIKTKLDS